MTNYNEYRPHNFLGDLTLVIFTEMSVQKEGEDKA